MALIARAQYKRADHTHTHVPFPWKIDYSKFVIPLPEVEWNADPPGTFLRAIAPYRSEAKQREMRGHMFDAAEELMYGYGSPIEAEHRLKPGEDLSRWKKAGTSGFGRVADNLLDEIGMRMRGMEYWCDTARTPCEWIKKGSRGKGDRSVQRKSAAARVARSGDVAWKSMFGK